VVARLGHDDQRLREGYEHIRRGSESS
jgi:hypothetical protein